MLNRHEKASPSHPSINPFKMDPLFQKSLQFCSNVSLRFREDKAPSLSLQCYIPSHRYLLCLCLTDYYTPQCQIFFSPNQGICKQHSTPALQEKQITLSLPMRHVSRVRLSGGYLLSFFRCFSCLFQVGASEKDGDGGQRGVSSSIDLM